jgi:hypothetical protein
MVMAICGLYGGGGFSPPPEEIAAPMTDIWLGPGVRSASGRIYDAFWQPGLPSFGSSVGAPFGQMNSDQGGYDGPSAQSGFQDDFGHTWHINPDLSTTDLDPTTGNTITRKLDGTGTSTNPAGEISPIRPSHPANVENDEFPFHEPNEFSSLMALNQQFSTADFLQLNQISATPVQRLPPAQTSTADGSVVLMASAYNSSGETPPEAVRIYNPDGLGSYDVLNPDGSMTNYPPPGGFVEQTTFNPDGSTTTRISTEAELVVSPDGETHSWYRPDGTLEYRENPDKSIDYYDDDGSLWGTQNADGTWKPNPEENPPPENGQSDFSWIQSESFWVVHGGAHIASTIFHSVTGFADSAGSAVRGHVASGATRVVEDLGGSNHVAAEVAGVAGVVVGAAVIGAIDMGGLVGSALALF